MDHLDLGVWAFKKVSRVVHYGPACWACLRGCWACLEFHLDLGVWAFKKVRSLIHWGPALGVCWACLGGVRWACRLEVHLG